MSSVMRMECKVSCLCVTIRQVLVDAVCDSGDAIQCRISPSSR